MDWPSRVRQQMSDGHYDVGIFMIGANDSGMPMIAGDESVMYPKKAWLEEYESRAKKIAALMLRGGADRVYWVGMPIMPSTSESKKMRDLNELFEDVAASSPDIVYVDSYDLLSTKDGDFKASVRSGDGVHYTNDGAMIVAKAVWQAIKLDWGAQAASAGPRYRFVGSLAHGRRRRPVAQRRRLPASGTDLRHAALSQTAPPSQGPAPRRDRARRRRRGGAARRRRRGLGRRGR